MIGMFRRRVMLPESGSGGGLQDGFYIIHYSGDEEGDGGFSIWGAEDHSVQVTWEPSSSWLNGDEIEGYIGALDIYAVHNGQWVDANDIYAGCVDADQGSNIEVITALQEDYEQGGMTHTVNIELNIDRTVSDPQIIVSCPYFNYNLTVNFDFGNQGSVEDNHEMKPIFVTYSNGQFDQEENSVSDSHIFYSTSTAESGYVFTKYIVGSSELGLGYTAAMAALADLTTNFGNNNAWELSVRDVSVNSALTSAWNEEGESVYEVDFNVRHVGTWVSNPDSNVTVNIYSGTNDPTQITLSVSML
jgi:hypothetical protein